MLPPGAREKSEQARSRFDLPAGAKDLVPGDVAAFRGLFADIRAGGDTVRCTVRGRLETADSEDRALLAVGDRVEFSRTSGGDGVIERLLPRRNFLVRGDRRVRRFRQVIAANIDGVALVTSVREPRFRPGIVDRFLVAASSQGLPASIVMNKSDLLEGRASKGREEIEAYRSLYEKIGVPVILTSALNRDGLDDLLRHLATGRVVLVGHSGVGKSTLLNALCPELAIKIRPVNRKTGKGTHTTTVATLLSLSGGIEAIDTPGIRELDIVDVASVDLEAHFSEFVPLIGKCEMNDCAHRRETGCPVRAGVESGEIHPRRYESYLTIREELEKAEHRYD